MGRCKKERCCREFDGNKLFKPAGIPLSVSGVEEISADEFEAVRLCDHDGLSQIEAAEVMKVSRGTIQRILSAGRYKIINALLKGSAIKIQSGEKK